MQDASNLWIFAAVNPVEEMKSGPIHRFGFLELSQAVQYHRVNGGIGQRFRMAWPMQLETDLPGSMSIGFAFGVAAARVREGSEVPIRVGGFIRIHLGMAERPPVEPFRLREIAGALVLTLVTPRLADSRLSLSRSKSCRSMTGARHAAVSPSPRRNAEGAGKARSSTGLASITVEIIAVSRFHRLVFETHSPRSIRLRDSRPM